ncbi:hypothetical protein MMPV_003367 [Pyropia vietnamensis]
MSSWRSATAFLPPPAPLLARFGQSAGRAVAGRAASTTSPPVAALRVYSSSSPRPGGGGRGGGGGGGSTAGRPLPDDAPDGSGRRQSGGRIDGSSQGRGGRGGGGASGGGRGGGRGKARVAWPVGVSPSIEDAIPDATRREGGWLSAAAAGARGGRLDGPAGRRGGGGGGGRGAAHRGDREGPAPSAGEVADATAVAAASSDVAAFAAAGLAAVVVRRGRARLFRDGGSPLVFGGAVSTLVAGAGVDTSTVTMGSPVGVVDGAGVAIGFGVYNPDSLYRVRLLRLLAPLPWEGSGSSPAAAADPNLDGDDAYVDTAGSKANPAIAGLSLAGEVRRRLVAAVALRDRLRLPAAGSTTAYRLVNGEGDRLSGLAVDVYESVAVVSSSAAWVEVHRPLVTEALRGVLPQGTNLIWRRSADRLKQDGWVLPTPALPSGGDDGAADGAATNTPAVTGGLTDAAGAEGPAGDEIEILEAGLRFVVSLQRGQKTGFYVDQRENRSSVGGVLPPASGAASGGGGRVLDAFCYTGGFGVHALAAGAAAVTFVDSSGAALALARRNVAANFPAARIATATMSTTAGLVMDAPPATATAAAGGNGPGDDGAAGACVEATFVTGDAVAALDALAAGGVANPTGFDVVVVDPPKLAPTAAVLDRAARKYGRINAAAIGTLSRGRGGVLISCTCSAAMSADRARFVDTVRSAGRAAGRELTLLRASGAAADHPVDPGSLTSSYLTVCWFAVSPAE